MIKKRRKNKHDKNKLNCQICCSKKKKLKCFKTSDQLFIKNSEFRRTFKHETKQNKIK